MQPPQSLLQCHREDTGVDAREASESSDNLFSDSLSNKVSD